MIDVGNVFAFSCLLHYVFSLLTDGGVAMPYIQKMPSEFVMFGVCSFE